MPNPSAATLAQLFEPIRDDLREVEREFAGQGFGAFKPKLADLAVSVMGPIGGEMRRLLADPGEIDRVLTDGALRARELAAPPVAEVKKLVGYWAG